VLVVDDHALVAHSLAVALRSRGIAATRCPSVRPADVRACAAEMLPRLVLLDLDLGDHVDGSDLIPDLRALGSEVLVFTGTRDRFRIAAAVAAGAVGWLSKSAPFETLLEQVVAAARGVSLMTPAEHQELVAHYHRGRAERATIFDELARLSQRERTVLLLLADGHQAEAVAAQLNVSVHTVRAQIRSIHVKLDVTSQLAAVALVRRAAELGLADPLHS
jgi:DNA-binding NarL/FixJ family response regulator